MRENIAYPPLQNYQWDLSWDLNACLPGFRLLIMMGLALDQVFS